MRKMMMLVGAAFIALGMSTAAHAKDPCIANCDGGGVSSSSANQIQGQAQHQGQHQNQNAFGGAGGSGGAGGAGGQGGNAVATGGNATAIAAGGRASASNTGVGNYQVSNYQAVGYAPDMSAVPPGLTGSIGFGVCATQDSHSDGVGIGVGVVGPSVGANFSHGNTVTNENLQCDLGRTAQIVCQMDANFIVDKKHHRTAGQVCAGIARKLAGVADVMAELDQQDEADQAALAEQQKQAAAARAATGWGHCDATGCYNAAGQKTN